MALRNPRHLRERALRQILPIAGSGEEHARSVVAREDGTLFPTYKIVIPQ
jgi:hypothetical protein